MIDLQIHLGDQTQDVLIKIGEIQETKAALTLASRDLEAFANTCCEADDAYHAHRDDEEFAAAVAELFGPEVATVVRSHLGEEAA